ncbi:hypothetical protein PENNAL_c0287G04968, partial [Penicillium nalgiovense]
MKNGQYAELVRFEEMTAYFQSQLIHVTLHEGHLLLVQRGQKLMGLKRNMNMSDLKLLKHYILHTSKRMTLHHDKALVWERVIPDIASENEYLMHLLLALTGLDVLTTESSLSQGSASSRGQSMANERMHESSLLQIVIEHHYQGLKGLQQEIDTSDHTNAEYLLAGSLLLVCFAFASLRVRDLDTSSQHYPAVNNSSQIGNYNLGKPQAQWLSLVHGVTSIVRQSWMELQKSRLRHLLVFNLANDDWKHLSYELSTPFKLHNDIRSAKLSLFMSNAFQAIYNLRTFSSTLKITIAANTKNDDLASSQSPGSDSSGDDSICSLLAEHDQAIDIVEMMYMRILHVLCLRRTGTQISDYEIQSEIEDAAIASWPDLVGQRFISSLNSQTLLRPAHGLSFTILAHLYLTLALLDNIWFFGGTFDLEIQKIGALITQIADVQLIELMKWPMAVISQGQGPQNSIQQ